MRKILLIVLIIFYSVQLFGQEIYTAKFSAGSESANKWYKLASIELGCSYNSANVSVNYHYINSSNKYQANAIIRFRKTPSSDYTDWQYKLSGQNVVALKLISIGSSTYELLGYSPSNWAHLATDIFVTRECTINVTAYDTPIAVENPENFTNVSFKGNWFYPNGSIGIGTLDTQGFKLAVNGTIGAKEVKVTSSGWSDFVFDRDYNLPTLSEVETFIHQNGHLPDIPSAEEVKADGISLGEMNAKLLQKIEELTLYVIEQNKKLEAQSVKLEVMEEENEGLKEENQSLKTDLLKEIETIKAQLK